MTIWKVQIVFPLHWYIFYSLSGTLACTVSLSFRMQAVILLNVGCQVIFAPVCIYVHKVFQKSGGINQIINLH